MTHDAAPDACRLDDPAATSGDRPTRGARRSAGRIRRAATTASVEPRA